MTDGGRSAIPGAGHLSEAGHAGTIRRFRISHSSFSFLNARIPDSEPWGSVDHQPLLDRDPARHRESVGRYIKITGRLWVAHMGRVTEFLESGHNFL